MKTCPRCRACLPLLEFQKNQAKPDGLQDYCKSCRLKIQRQDLARPWRKAAKNAAQRALRQRNRRRLRYFLMQRPCFECGERDHRVLEFDHFDHGPKRANVADMMHYSWEAINRELMNCQILCANCHRRRTAEQQGWG